MTIYTQFATQSNTHSHCVSTPQNYQNPNIGYSILQATLTLPLQIHTLNVYRYPQNKKINHKIMRTNLSSRIVLYQVPQKYYKPNSALEMSGISRFEKIKTHITTTTLESSKVVAQEIASLIRKKAKENKMCVLCFTSGRSPIELFDELVRLHNEEGLSFKNVITFNLFEYYPLDINFAQSCLNQIKANLLDKVDILPENIHSIDPTLNQSEIALHCAEYEQKIDNLGGIDYQVLGIGGVGNIGFNEPGSQASSQTRLILLDPHSRKEAVHFFGSIDKVPAGAITMGINTILKSRQISLLAFGEHKANIIKTIVEGQMSDQHQASFLQMHTNTTVYLDINSASALTRISCPWLVTSCEWNDKLTRRAIVWLCQKTGKPILKLTNKDYNENGLSKLVALYGSA